MTADKQVASGGQALSLQYDTDIHTTLLFLLRQIVRFFSCFGKLESSTSVLYEYPPVYNINT